MPLEFVNAHAKDWSAQTHALTMAYFEWMNDQIVEQCQCSIEDIVGMPLTSYVSSVYESICPDHADQGRFYLLLSEKQAVAMGGVRRLPDGSAEVVRIYTDPSHRGNGYGAVMLDKLISDAVIWGCEKIKLDTGNFMTSAHKLYESLGFKDTDPYVGAEPPAKLFPYWRFMEKSLIGFHGRPRAIQ